MSSSIILTLHFRNLTYCQGGNFKPPYRLRNIFKLNSVYVENIGYMHFNKLWRQALLVSLTLYDQLLKHITRRTVKVKCVKICSVSDTEMSVPESQCLIPWEPQYHRNYTSLHGPKVGAVFLCILI